MASNKREYWTTLGARLAEERHRCGHTQKSVAERFDITARTQIKYELGETGPDAYYLHGLGEIGMDVPYVLTGRRSVLHVSEDESDLIAIYRMIDGDIRASLTDLLRCMERMPGAGQRRRQIRDGRDAGAGNDTRNPPHRHGDHVTREIE